MEARREARQKYLESLKQQQQDGNATDQLLPTFTAPSTKGNIIVAPVNPAISGLPFNTLSSAGSTAAPALNQLSANPPETRSNDPVSKRDKLLEEKRRAFFEKQQQVQPTYSNQLANFSAVPNQPVFLSNLTPTVQKPNLLDYHIKNNSQQGDFPSSSAFNCDLDTKNHVITSVAMATDSIPSSKHNANSILVDNIPAFPAPIPPMGVARPVVDSDSVNLSRWKSLGFASEYAYAKSLGLLNDKPPVHDVPTLAVATGGMQQRLDLEARSFSDRSTIVNHGHNDSAQAVGSFSHNDEAENRRRLQEEYSRQLLEQQRHTSNTEANRANAVANGSSNVDNRDRLVIGRSAQGDIEEKRRKQEEYAQQLRAQKQLSDGFTIESAQRSKQQSDIGGFMDRFSQRDDFEEKRRKQKEYAQQLTHAAAASSSSTSSHPANNHHTDGTQFSNRISDLHNVNHAQSDAGFFDAFSSNDGKEEKRRKQEEYARQLQQSEFPSQGSHPAVNHYNNNMIIISNHNASGSANNQHENDFMNAFSRKDDKQEKRRKQEEYARQIQQGAGLSKAIPEQHQVQKHSDYSQKLSSEPQPQRNLHINNASEREGGFFDGFSKKDDKEEKRRKQEEYARQLQDASALPAAASSSSAAVKNTFHNFQQPSANFNNNFGSNNKTPDIIIEDGFFDRFSKRDNKEEKRRKQEAYAFQLNVESAAVAMHDQQPFSSASRDNPANDLHGARNALASPRSPNRQVSKALDKAEYARHLLQQMAEKPPAVRTKGKRTTTTASVAAEEEHNETRYMDLGPGWEMGPLGVPVRKTLEVGDRKQQREFHKQIMAQSSPDKTHQKRQQLHQYQSYHQQQPYPSSSSFAAAVGGEGSRDNSRLFGSEDDVSPSSQPQHRLPPGSLHQSPTYVDGGGGVLAQLQSAEAVEKARKQQQRLKQQELLQQQIDEKLRHREAEKQKRKQEEEDELRRLAQEQLIIQKRFEEEERQQKLKLQLQAQEDAQILSSHKQQQLLQQQQEEDKQRQLEAYQSKQRPSSSLADSTIVVSSQVFPASATLAVESGSRDVLPTHRARGVAEEHPGVVGGRVNASLFDPAPASLHRDTNNNFGSSSNNSNEESNSGVVRTASRGHRRQQMHVAAVGTEVDELPMSPPKKPLTNRPPSSSSTFVAAADRLGRLISDRTQSPQNHFNSVADPIAVPNHPHLQHNISGGNNSYSNSNNTGSTLSRGSHSNHSHSNHHSNNHYINRSKGIGGSERAEVRTETHFVFPDGSMHATLSSFQRSKTDTDPLTQLLRIPFTPDRSLQSLHDAVSQAESQQSQLSTDLALATEIRAIRGPPLVTAEDKESKEVAAEVNATTLSKCENEKEMNLQAAGQWNAQGSTRAHRSDGNNSIAPQRQQREIRLVPSVPSIAIDMIPSEESKDPPQLPLQQQQILNQHTQLQNQSRSQNQSKIQSSRRPSSGGSKESSLVQFDRIPSQSPVSSDRFTGQQQSRAKEMTLTIQNISSSTVSSRPSTARNLDSDHDSSYKEDDKEEPDDDAEDSAVAGAFDIDRAYRRTQKHWQRLQRLHSFDTDAQHMSVPSTTGDNRSSSIKKGQRLLNSSESRDDQALSTQMSTSQSPLVGSGKPLRPSTSVVTSLHKPVCDPPPSVVVAAAVNDGSRPSSASLRNSGRLVLRHHHHSTPQPQQRHDDDELFAVFGL